MGHGRVRCSCSALVQMRKEAPLCASFLVYSVHLAESPAKPLQSSDLWGCGGALAKGSARSPCVRSRGKVMLETRERREEAGTGGRLHDLHTCAVARLQGPLFCPSSRIRIRRLTLSSREPHHQGEMPCRSCI